VLANLQVEIQKTKRYSIGHAHLFLMVLLITTAPLLPLRLSLWLGVPLRVFEFLSCVDDADNGCCIGQMMDFSQFKGKVVLVENVASM
jgi:hypothetical protein